MNKKGALNTEASEISSIYKILYGKDPKSFDEAKDGLNYYFSSSTEVSADTTKVTLGKGYDTITPEVLLIASSKLFSFSKGKASPDERDSLIFKELYGVDDLLIQHFKKQQPILTSKLGRTLGLKNDVAIGVADIEV